MNQLTFHSSGERKIFSLYCYSIPNSDNTQKPIRSRNLILFYIALSIPRSQKKNVTRRKKKTKRERSTKSMKSSCQTYQACKRCLFPFTRGHGLRDLIQILVAYEARKPIIIKMANCRSKARWSRQFLRFPITQIYIFNFRPRSPAPSHRFN